MSTASTTHIVLIPSYNPGPKVVETVLAARRQWNPVWVVVDGSTDSSADTLQTLATGDPGLSVLVLPENRGKGAAVLEGITRAAAAGFTHALTMDSDGQHPADLIHHECLGYTGTPNPLLWEFIIDGRPKGFPIRGRLLASNGDVLLQAATAGFGLTCAPAFVCADALRSGTVTEILTGYAIAPLGIHVLLPGNRLVPQRVRALMNFLAERLGQDPPWNI